MSAATIDHFAASIEAALTATQTRPTQNRDGHSAIAPSNSRPVVAGRK